MREPHSRRKCFAATVAIASWLAVILIALICACTAQGAESHRQQTVCRVYNQQGGSSSVGSGTLIDKTDDGREGLVLTCAHLFREGVGQIIVEFPNGRRHAAKFVAVDHQADLAALAIANPVGTPVAVSLESDSNQTYYACGYGPRGVYRCAVGSIVGSAANTGQISLMIDDPVRSGDSGGGVFDAEGRLVAVIWGEAQGVTYASTGKPLQDFLSRVLGRRTSVVYRCPGGVCPLPAKPPRQEKPPTSNARWQQLQSQIDRLKNEKQDRGDYLTRNELSAYALSEQVERVETSGKARHSQLLEKIASLSKSGARAVVLSTLGISGPTGWGILAASTVAGWLVGRHRTRRSSGARGRRRRPFQK